MKLRRCLYSSLLFPWMRCGRLGIDVDKGLGEVSVGEGVGV